MKGDTAVEKGADRLEQLADKAEQKGGVGEKVAEELAGDAQFLRKLKPSLVVARAKGDAPTDAEPGEPRRAPAGPQLRKRPKPRGGKGRALAVVGAAFVAGIVLAKLVDWRGHAHPRR